MRPQFVFLLAFVFAGLIAITVLGVLHR